MLVVIGFRVARDTGASSKKGLGFKGFGVILKKIVIIVRLLNMLAGIGLIITLVRVTY